jgi:hypothetical protein
MGPSDLLDQESQGAVSKHLRKNFEHLGYQIGFYPQRNLALVLCEIVWSGWAPWTVQIGFESAALPIWDYLTTV